MKRLILALLIISLILVSGISGCNASKVSGECKADSDCLPSSCCHPSSCVEKSLEPQCSGIMCTQECAPNTLDCGQGSCRCIEGKCAAEMK